MTREFLIWHSLKSKQRVESPVNYAHGEFSDCLGEVRSVHAFMQESSLGVQTQWGQPLALNAEHQPGIKRHRRALRLSPPIESQSGAAPLPVCLKVTWPWVVCRHFGRSTWRKNPFLRMWFPKLKAHIDSRKWWFFFDFSFTLVLVIVSTAVLYETDCNAALKLTPAFCLFIWQLDEQMLLGNCPTNLLWTVLSGLSSAFFIFIYMYSCFSLSNNQNADPIREE